MLVYGTANPEGFGDHRYDGLYLTDSDIRLMIPEMVGTPIKVEHRGEHVGKVISAWQSKDGRMDVVFELNGANLESSLASRFVKDGYCNELSLGYRVEMSKGASGKLTAGRKRIVELSLVMHGARDNCKIRGFGSSTHKIVS
jgi:hypothetical protein